MDWTGEATTERGVTERTFGLEHDGRKIPGILWAPEAGPEGCPLLLLGHGGTNHKRTDYVLASARRAVRQHGFMALAIDGPGHGDRLAPGETVDFDSAWGRDEVTEETTADWRATLDAVQNRYGATRVAYFGLSMGTMMGVPLIAAEPRIEAALLGLMGVWGPNGRQIRDAAPGVQCPVRFLVQWDDEVVPRETAFKLFGELGTTRKEMRVHPGKHVAVPAAEMRDFPGFLANELARKP